MSIVYLDLPMLPENAIQECLIAAKKHINLSQNKQYDDFLNIIKDLKFNNNQKFGKYEVLGNVWSYNTRKQLKNLYREYFTEDIYFSFGKFSNMHSINCSFPPHRDKNRCLGINFLIVSGGDHVETVTYSKKISNNTITKKNINNPYNDKIINYENVIVDVKECVPIHKWYCFNADEFHSLENLQSDRYVVFLILKDKEKVVTYNHFIKKYNHLIKKS